MERRWWRWRPARGAEAPVPLVLAGAAGALYWPATRLFWLYDDPFQLRFVLGHQPLAYWLVPAAWRELPNRVFTPWLLTSLDLDASLFGSAPLPFYLHQLLALSLATVALYLLLRRWLPPGWAAVAGLLFLLGVPTANCARLLMARHYLEGLAFAAGATGLYLAAARRRNVALGAASAALYLLSAAAKEIFVPLPFLLMGLGAGRLRERLRACAPHLAALVAYAAWRRAMLGTFLGGYGWALTPEEAPALLASLPGKAAWGLVQPSPVAGTFLLAVLLGSLVACLWVRRRRLLGLGCLVLALLPVLPVSKAFEPRFSLAAWVLLAAGMGFAGHWMSGKTPWLRRLAVAAAVVALGAAAVVWRAAARTEMARFGRMSEEGRVFLRLGESDVLVHPLSPAATLRELIALEREGLAGHRLPGPPSAADWFHDEIYLCAAPGSGAARYWAWKERGADPFAAIGFSDATATVLDRRRRFCRDLGEERPLSARFRLRRGVLWWSLGPYSDGGYALVLDDGRFRLDVPREGGFQVGAGAALAPRVRYASPEGWLTYSLPLALDFERGEAYEWRRPAEP